MAQQMKAAPTAQKQSEDVSAADVSDFFPIDELTKLGLNAADILKLKQG